MILQHPESGPISSQAHPFGPQHAHFPGAISPQENLESSCLLPCSMLQYVLLMFSCIKKCDMTMYLNVCKVPCWPGKEDKAPVAYAEQIR